jgi:hypothetical protein
MLVLYAYGDWLKRYGGLDALARHAGLEPVFEVGIVGSGTEAGVIRRKG